MRSPSTYSRNKEFGFTLLEVLVVMAITTGLIALGLFMSMETYRGVNFRSEREVVVSLLQKARNRSMNNIYQTTWGVCYVAPNYILFRGSACTPSAATSESTPASPAVTITGLGTGIVFSQLAGTTTGSTIVVTQNDRTSNIVINNEGTISW